MLASGPLLRHLGEVIDQTPDDRVFDDAIPEEIFQASLEEYEKADDRFGVKLPFWLTLRLIVHMALLRHLDIRSVLDRVARVFGTPTSWRGGVPHSTSIAQARDRLGLDVVQGLFKRFAVYLADWDPSRWKGLLVVAIDGTMLDAPDSLANVSEFGRPGGRNGSSGFPKFRLVAVVSTLSHFVLGCVTGACKGPGTGEKTLVHSLLPLLQPDWLILMDSGFCSFPWLKALGDRPFFVRKTQGKTAVKPRKVERAIKPRADHWVDYLPVSSKSGEAPLRLRWIRINVNKKKRGRKAKWVEFLTNLPPERYPYDELVSLYMQRWEVEFAFRELKVDLLKKVMFRSQTPTRVLQETYGLLLAYNSIRLRMAQAAKLAKVEPRRISFTYAVAILQLAALNGLRERHVLLLLGSKQIHKRPSRSYPRQVKRPAAKFPANRRRADSG